MAPTAGASTAPPDDQPDRSLPTEKSGSPSIDPTGSASENPTSLAAAAAIGGPSEPSSSRVPDGISSEVDPATAVDASNPNPNPNGAKGKDTSSHREEPSAPRSYATVAADKARRPPPAFVMNLNAFHPVKRGTAIVLKMPEDLYQKRLSAFTHALIGRIFLPKSSPPRALPDLKSELQLLFKTSHDWNLIPLGKGFFLLSLLIRRTVSWPPGLLLGVSRLEAFILGSGNRTSIPTRSRIPSRRFGFVSFIFPRNIGMLNFWLGFFGQLATSSSWMAALLLVPWDTSRVPSLKLI